MAARYGWRPGSHIKIDAEKAGRELHRMEKQDGGLTPENVLERAKSANSALHGHFEWDDTEAARQHRLGQARELISSIVVDVSRSNVEASKPVRAFVSVQEGGRSHYADTARAMSDIDLRRQVLQRAWAELQSFRRKYGELQELAGVFSAIDKVRPAA